MRIIIAVLCSLVVSAAADEAKRVSTIGGTPGIHNYRAVDERYGTAGQPTEEQLKAAAAEGYKTIINLATIDPRYSLKDEGGVANSLGMKYHHIPVPWEHPSDADFAAFERAMQSAGEGKTLVHCAANFRATAFYSLYALKHLGWSPARAAEFRASIWHGSHFPVWDEFISRTQAAILDAHKTKSE
jgi:protein tyrosine phosphatase (PTP) superfamily phosphohydrolase (DUF442 family)